MATAKEVILEGIRQVNGNLKEDLSDFSGVKLKERGSALFTSEEVLDISNKIYSIAKNRLPVVVGVTNINKNHDTTIRLRDFGWIQLYSDSQQEIYDNYIQGVKIAENKELMMPVMICENDLSEDNVEDIKKLDDEKVKEFVGEFNVDGNISNLTLDRAMTKARSVIKEVAKDYEKITGRKYSFFEEYKVEDADVVIVILNNVGDEAKKAVDELRLQNKKVGLIKIRVFRPFPFNELKHILTAKKAVGVIDTCEGFSAAGGPLFIEVRSSLYDSHDRPEVFNYVAAFGERALDIEDFKSVFTNLLYEGKAKLLVEDMVEIAYDPDTLLKNTQDFQVERIYKHIDKN